MAEKETKWSLQEIDAALELLLAAKDKPGYLGICDRLAAHFYRIGYLGKGNTVERFIWGLICRYRGKVYEGPGPFRVRRSGTVTFGELEFIRIARECDSEETMPMDVDYLADLFARELEDAKAIWHQYGPDKGRRSFGLNTK